jgi:hypothetical protein
MTVTKIGSWEKFSRTVEYRDFQPSVNGGVLLECEPTLIEIDPSEIAAHFHFFQPFQLPESPELEDLRAKHKLRASSHVSYPKRVTEIWLKDGTELLCEPVLLPIFR